MKTENMILLGCGGVGRCLLELLKIDDNELQYRKITIIEPRALPNWIHTYYPKAKHIKVAITKDNLERVIEPLLKSGTIFVDVSVDVDCIPIMKLCQKHNTIYINTSLENWETLDASLQDAFEERTLYHRFNQIKKELKKDTTALFDNGMNPGLISQFCKLALYDYAMIHGDTETKEYAEKGKFNMVAYKTGLTDIHISEHDTQKTYHDNRYGSFWNTWSPLGFQSEANDPIMIGGNKKPFKNVQYIKPKTGLKNVLFINKRGCDMLAPTVGVDDEGNEIGFTGYLIPHGESNTLSAELRVPSKKYIPTVYYVYRPSDIAIESLNEMKKNNYKVNHDWHTLENEDIKNGYDSVGVTLYFNNGHIWWAGTVLSMERVREMGFKYGTATTLQVAISILRAVEYMLNKHKHEGLINPEELPYRQIIDSCKKYLGNVYSKQLLVG